MQRCLSGLRSTTGNRVYLARVPRVQIPLSAPAKKGLPKRAVLFLVMRKRLNHARRQGRAKSGRSARASVHASGLCPRRSAEGAPSGFRLNISLRRLPLPVGQRTAEAGSPFFGDAEAAEPRAAAGAGKKRSVCPRVGSRERAVPATLSRGGPFGVSAEYLSAPYTRCLIGDGFLLVVNPDMNGRAPCG